ncbi:MAG: glutamate--tRNA ligase 1 [marine bacterium B5-7]|nr:MAG: glutamate--tRNA ligase 1 [marine bacterium B5-7]
MSTKTRFAPSPTGDLHIGGVRTALFSWLYAKNQAGRCLLRIEDTDVARSTTQSADAILEGMQWLGLDFDGPVYQSDRTAVYQEAIDRLVQEDKAYRCYCSKERLDALREEQKSNKQKPRYDGHCAHLTDPQAGDYVIRFRNPQEGSVVFDDAVRGRIEVANAELDDLIIARSDGSPTYNFTVVVDDAEMAITHVVRGDDHINNTPRQINLFYALGLTPPTYGHVPMILGPDGKRLSKRDGAASVLQYREDGYLPEAMLNYLVRLGWSHGDQELFSLEEMVQLFSLDKLQRSPASINPEKLLWLNQHYLKTCELSYVLSAAAWQAKHLNLDVSQGPDFSAVVDLQRERCKTLVELVESSRFFYEDFDAYEEKAAKKNFKVGTVDVLKKVLDGMQSVSDWSAEPVHQVILDTAEALDLKLGKVAQPIRVAIAGCAVSPSLDVTLVLLGRDKTLARLQRAIEFCGED